MPIGRQSAWRLTVVRLPNYYAESKGAMETWVGRTAQKFLIMGDVLCTNEPCIRRFRNDLLGRMVPPPRRRVRPEAVTIHADHAVIVASDVERRLYTRVLRCFFFYGR